MRLSALAVLGLLAGLLPVSTGELAAPAAAEPNEPVSTLVAAPATAPIAAPPAEQAATPATAVAVPDKAPAVPQLTTPPVEQTAAPPAPDKAPEQSAAMPATPTKCPGNPHALGTSRTMVVDPNSFPRIGNIQYSHTLPLNDHEVVITFDDGPLPPYSDHILDTLASECVKVTYFMVGQMAAAYPSTVRRIYNAGHVIGTHSLSHPFHFDQMGQPRVEHEVEGGIASVKAALGDPRAVAPFFRIPGLARSHQVEQYLASQSLAVWSADEVADDWRHISAEQIVIRAMRRIEAHDHRGVLLLHDIQPATALAMPALLAQLKAKGYHIVQAVPVGERPPSVPDHPAPAVASGGWPRVVKTKADKEKPVHAAQRKQHKRLAMRDDDDRPTRHGQRAAKDDHAKPSRLAARDESKRHDARLEAALAKKKHKSQTAERDKKGNQASLR